MFAVRRRRSAQLWNIVKRNRARPSKSFARTLSLPKKGEEMASIELLTGLVLAIVLQPLCSMAGLVLPDRTRSIFSLAWCEPLSLSALYASTKKNVFPKCKINTQFHYARGRSKRDLLTGHALTVRSASVSVSEHFSAHFRWPL